MSAELAVVGLGVMGASLARNFRSRGLTVAVTNRETDWTDRFLAAHGPEGFVRCDDYPSLVDALTGPRVVLLMITAGPAVDAVLGALLPLLSPGDIVVDGGNSYWADTDRRVARAAEAGVHFVGMGVSGGQEGALNGPSMMPGGSRSTWHTLRPLLEPAAAVAETGPCVAWCGHGSAGHAAKMVHNGIEYGDMQLIAEVWTLLGQGLGRSPGQVADTLAGWNGGRLESFLVEISATIAAAKDPQGAGPLVDQILDVAGQKGTGRWTVRDAVEIGVAVPTIAAAVDARVLSARPQDRQVAGERLSASSVGLVGVDESDLEAALYAAKLLSYTQGFDLLRQTSAERGYDTDLAELARIWKAGCIIRAAFLDRVTAAFRADPDLPLLALAPDFASELREDLPALRRVVGAATLAGLPVPALAASLTYFDTLRTARGSAALIQAQRDFFGAHTYRRVDAPEVAVHTDWGSLDRVE